MRQAQREVWDVGGAEASYEFASAEEKEKKRKKRRLSASLFFERENYLAIHTRYTFSFLNMMASATVSELRGRASRISMSFVSSDAERSE